MHSNCSSFTCHRNRYRYRCRGLLTALILSALFAGVAGDAARAQSDTDSVIRESNETISDSKQRISEKESERQRLRQDADAATSELDVAQATADDLIRALDAVSASVDAQQDAFNNAVLAVVEAEATQLQAALEIAEQERRLAESQQSLQDDSIQRFVNLLTPEGSLSVLDDDPWEHSRTQALYGITTGSRIDKIDDFRRDRAELERWKMIAEEAAVSARENQERQAVLLVQLEEAQRKEAALVLEAEERLEHKLHEVQHLRDLDAAAAAEIESEERRIAEALNRRRIAEEERRRAEEEARRAAEEARRQTGSTSGVTSDGKLELVWVSGIQVNVQIAEQTAGLLAAMEAEGFKVSGWGYRTHQAQISLRRAHCGTSEYAIWQMPSSRCRPPTARPGRSNHEVGLAIDFTYNGRIVSSRSSAVFQALTRIAPQYGLKNLPSEPWHWSVNGR